MTDGWHYAEGGKTVGPLDLKEMQVILSKISDPRNLRVWKVGFKGWERAGNVPELAEGGHMRAYEDDERDYTAACVITAFKRYSRTRRIKNAALAVVAFTAAVLPWSSDEVPWLHGLSKLANANILAWYIGILVVLLYGYTEQRLRTMQIRLATMHDVLHRIAGDPAEQQDELLNELVAEVGPVDPDPKFLQTQRNSRAG